MKVKIIMFALLIGTLLACSSGGGNGENPSPSLVSLAITPSNPSITAGNTQQFTASGTYSDNTTQDLTSSATWTAADTTVATVSSGGLATSHAAGSTAITASSGTVRGSATLTVLDASVAKRTFIMIHLEAGYKACKAANNLPPALAAAVSADDVCSPGWQEYFWPTLIELVDKANEYGFKLTLAFNPQWGEYIANDSQRLDLVRQWKTQGHEIGFHHHWYGHPDWDGYSNETNPDSDVLKDPLYRGPVNDGFSLVNTLTSPDSIISSTLTGTADEYPSLMNSPTVVFGDGDQFNSYYPLFGTELRSLKPVMLHTTERDIVQLTMRQFSPGMEISLDEAFPILQYQYWNMQEDEVFGIVWHEFDYYLAKNWYIQWFDFIKANGNSVKTMKEIATEYFK